MTGTAVDGRVDGRNCCTDLTSSRSGEDEVRRGRLCSLKATRFGVDGESGVSLCRLSSGPDNERGRDGERVGDWPAARRFSRTSK